MNSVHDMGGMDGFEGVVIEGCASLLASSCVVVESCSTSSSSSIIVSLALGLVA